MLRINVLFLAIVLAAIPVAAIADPVELSIGLVADVDAVHHVINGAVDDFVAPLPFFTFEARTSHIALAAEALTTFVPLQLTGERTKLDVDIAAVRVTVAHGIFAGVGLTSLNQTTTFDPEQITVGATDNLTERSHLNGIRYEAGYENRRFSAVVAATPVLTGHVFDHCVQATSFSAAHPCFDQDYTTIDLPVPEISSELDATVRYTVPLASHVDLVTGFRYITFIGRMTYPNFIASDQNRGAPLLSVGLRAHTR